MIFVGVFDLSLVFFESRDETGDERLNSLSVKYTYVLTNVLFNVLILFKFDESFIFISQLSTNRRKTIGFCVNADCNMYLKYLVDPIVVASLHCLRSDIPEIYPNDYDILETNFEFHRQFVRSTLSNTYSKYPLLLLSKHFHSFFYMLLVSHTVFRIAIML